MPFGYIADEARALVERERRSLREPGSERCDRFWHVAEHLLDALLEMVHDQLDQPAEQLEPAVRRLLLEQTSYSESGEMLDPEWEACFEHRVHDLMRLLERVRQHALSQGRWYSAPLAPMMFG